MDDRLMRYAREALQDIRERNARWEEEAERYDTYGYRPHYCVHGTNMWTDHDPICVGCEDALSPLEEAMSIARGRYAEWEYRFTAAVEATVALEHMRSTDRDMYDRIRDMAHDWARQA